MLNSPCKNCPDRYVGCHAECEKYKDFRKNYDEIITKRQKIKKEEDDWFRSRRGGSIK